MDKPTLSNRDLLDQLERLAGRRIKTREDIADYAREMSAQAMQSRTRSLRLKNALLVTLLAAAAAQYYFIDVQLQILSQTPLTVFLPVKAGAQGSHRGG